MADSTWRGIREFVVGTGGVPLYDFQAIKPNSEVRLKTHGVIRLTLSNDRYDWDFLATAGAWRYRIHGLPLERCFRLAGHCLCSSGAPRQT